MQPRHPDAGSTGHDRSEQTVSGRPFRIYGRTLAWWRSFAAYRLHLRRCRHPLYVLRYSRRHRHPDGRGESYDRCAVCLRVLWRAWDTYPYNRHRLSIAAWVIRRRYRRQAPAVVELPDQQEHGSPVESPQVSDDARS